MILSPRKSVTRFFIPLIDVLILLFCIFLLMPFVSGPDPVEPGPAAKDKAAEPALPEDVTQLQRLLKEEQMKVARMEREKFAKLTDRLAVRVLEIDPASGTLYYYDPAREDIKTDADAERLIRKQKDAAATGGGVKDVFFLILYPRRVPGRPLSPYPTGAQEEQMKRWFKDVPFGFDIPALSP
ncbi:unnamed protein product [Gemmataceae bacterium]|nr:unnamed protein product [Gemmataceae bacterium]VTT99473.1 unnamed protein product [Gemmataceae bacterium]